MVDIFYFTSFDSLSWHSDWVSAQLPPPTEEIEITLIDSSEEQVNIAAIMRKLELALKSLSAQLLKM